MGSFQDKDMLVVGGTSGIGKVIEEEVDANQFNRIHF